MEVTLKGLQSLYKQDDDRCRFNPCFNGSDSKRMTWKTGFIFCGVSILVLMEVTLKG